MQKTAEPVKNTAELGRLLRAHRKAQGLLQVDAAALAGVGERFLSELERGKTTAEIGLVFKVIERFGLTLTLSARGPSGLASPDDKSGLS